MGTEIERKFLVSGTAWRAAVVQQSVFQQGYLLKSNGASLRVRIVDDAAAVITFKTAGSGLSRGEYEYAIPLADARELLHLAGQRTVAKRRHTLVHAGKTWVVDEFTGRHAGLVLAEIELETEDGAFETPPWAAREVTGDPTYSNAELAEPSN